MAYLNPGFTWPYLQFFQAWLGDQKGLLQSPYPFFPLTAFSLHPLLLQEAPSSGLGTP